MMIICKNCNQHFKGKYCNFCGQAAETHDINIKFLWHDIQHGLLHFDKGIFYTIKQLFTRPGYAIKEFIEGKRVKHYKPISLVLILAGIYGLLWHFFHIDATALIKDSNPQKINFKKFMDWITEHYAIGELVYLPLVSIASYFAFKKSNFNFIEHIVLNAFLIGQRLVISIILFPLLYIYNGTSKMASVTTATSILGAVIIFWAYAQFFKPQKLSKTILLSFLTYFYLFLEIIFLSFVFGIFYAYTEVYIH